MNNNILIYITVALLSIDLSKCVVVPQDLYLSEAKKHMEEKYRENFSTPYMYDDDVVMMSPMISSSIKVVAGYADWDGDGDEEWGDNYMMYKFRPVMNEDVANILNEIYDEYKFHIDMNNRVIPDITTKEEIYEVGVNIYIYTTKKLDNKDEDIIAVIDGIKNIGLQAFISINYVNDKEFSYAGPTTAGRINQYKLYNAKKEIFMYEDIEEDTWEYGNVEE